MTLTSSVNYKDSYFETLGFDQNPRRTNIRKSQILTSELKASAPARSPPSWEEVIWLHLGIMLSAADYETIAPATPFVRPQSGPLQAEGTAAAIALTTDLHKTAEASSSKSSSWNAL
jgi:hypothetical protein